ncbi:MAG: hypothetical protein ABJA82_02775 [Myxococcales bacterium]
MSTVNGNTTVYDEKKAGARVVVPPGFPWQCLVVAPGEAADPKLLSAGFLCVRAEAAAPSSRPAIYLRAACKKEKHDSSSSTADLGPDIDGLGGVNDRSVTVLVLCTTS